MNKLRFIAFSLLIVLFMTFMFGCSSDKEAIGIEIISQPEKTEYLVGDTISFDGLIVKVKYDDESYSDDIEINSLNVSIPNTTDVGKKTVTIKYSIDDKEYEVYYEIVVSSKKVNEHNYATEWSSDKDNHWHACIDEGYETLTKDVSAHTYDNGVVTSAPTFDKTGIKTYTCTVCDHTYTEVLEMLTHNYSNDWSYDENNHWYPCIDEGYETLTKDSSAHTYDNGVVTLAPAFDKTGIKTYTCTVCDHTYTEVIEMLTHNYSNDWSYDEDNHWHVCTDEGFEHLIINEVPHIYKGIVTKEATHQSTGIKTYTCTVCDYSYTEVIEMLIHNYATSWSSDKDNHWHTCTDEGYEDLKANESAHIYDNGVVTLAPTFDKTGIKTYTCTVCDHSYTEVIEMLVHNYSTDWSYGENNHWHTCTDEGYETLTKDSSAHTYDNGVVTLAPTFDKTGVKTYTCTICNHTYTEVIEMLSHNYSNEWSSDKDNHWHTCTDEGYETLVKDTSAHTYDNTCDATCNICNYMRKVTHTFDQPQYIEPTCQHEGKTIHRCTGCSYYYIDSYINSLEHDYDDTYHCKECGEAMSSDGLEFVFKLSYNKIYKSGYWVNGYTGNDASVTIPNYYNNYPVIGVNDGVFANCQNTIRICLPSTLEYIGECAFAYSNIKYVEIPEVNDLVYVNWAAFRNTLWEENSKTVDLGYNILGNVLFNNNYTKISKKELIVPEGIEFISGRFDNKDLTLLSLPSTIIIINEDAFCDSGLVNVNIPNQNNLEEVGSNAFANTPFMAAFEPNKIAYLGNVALGYVYSTTEEFNLDTLVIPEGVYGIAGKAFINIDVSKVVLPSSLRYIGDEAFKGASIKEVIMPSNIELHTIGYCAFANCALSTFTIPKSVTNFDYSAVYAENIFIEKGNPRYTIENGMLIDMTEGILLTNYYGYDIPDNIRYISSMYPVSGFGDDFELVIPDSVVYINDSAIYGFPNVKVTGKLDYVGVCAFANCGEVFFADEKPGVNWNILWNNNAYSHFSNMPCVHFSSHLYFDEDGHWFLENEEDVINKEEHVYEYGICTICGYCNNIDNDFYGYLDIYGGACLTEYVGSSNVLKIPDYFIGYPVTSISSNFTFPDYVNSIIIGSNVISIGEFAFARYNILNVVIPDINSLLFVGKNAFLNTTWLDNQTDDMLVLGNVLIGWKEKENLKVPEGIISICQNHYSVSDFSLYFEVSLPSTLIYFEQSLLGNIQVFQYKWTSKPAKGFAIIDGNLYKESNCGWFLFSLSRASVRSITEISKIITIANKIDGKPVVGMLPYSMNYLHQDGSIRIILGDENFVFIDSLSLLLVDNNYGLYYMFDDYNAYWFNTKNDIEITFTPVFHTHEITHYEALEAGCENGNKEYWICEECGVVFLDESCSQYATIKEIEGIVIVGKGHKESNWYFDEISHWQQCTDCKEKYKYECHVYDNDCDPSCNICGAQRIAPHNITEELSKDANNHWHECSSCHTKFDLTIHTGGTATCTQKAICSICGIEYGEFAEHTGGTATCTQKAVCSICETEYGELADHDLIKVSEIGPTCTNKGVFAHDHCVLCDKDFIDGVEKSANDLVILALGHTGGTATCLQKAVCTRCEAQYGDYTNHDYIDDECTLCHNERNSEGLIFSLINNGTEYSVLGYKGSATRIKILPTHADGLPITIIGNNAFFNCSNIESIVLPPTITSIGNSAFYNCTSLESIIMPPTITSIGNSAFSGCTKLLDITIPFGVSIIDEVTFYGCTSLKTITIPSSVIIIKQQAFIQCNSLESVIIESGVETIADNVFNNCEKLKSVSLPTSMKTIGSFAFCGCTELEDLVLNNGLQTIGISAFQATNKLVNIIIPSSVVTIESDAFHYSDEKNIHCYATEKPEGWDEDWLGSTITNLTWGHTYGDWTINDDTHIHYCTILDCTHSETEAHDWVDDVCIVCHKERNTEGLVFSTINNGTEYSVQSYTGSATKIRILSEYNGKPVTTIDTSAFQAKAITEVILPLSITTIKENAFKNCASLKRINIPSGVENISAYVFQDCTALTGVTIAEGVKKIGFNTFRNCTNLVNINLPSSLETIGTGAFCDCSLLENINLPSTLKDLGSSAFSKCTALKNITIPANITVIKSSTFYSCSSLENITIPSNIITIEEIAFKLCTSLETLTIESGLKTIGNSSFSNCSALRSLTLPSSVEYIDISAFVSCTLLEKVVLNEGLLSIGSYAFSSNAKLKSINIPLSVTTMAENVFYGLDTSTIHCYIEEKPVGWNEKWILNPVTVIWGHNLDSCINNGDDTHTHYCTVAGCTYNETATHDYSEVWNKDETHHWHECIDCHAIEGVKAVHVYDNNCDTTCNICEAIRTITHDYSEVWDKDEMYHWHECNVCHAIEGVKVVHVYDNNCDTICNICEAIRTITHDYSEVWDKDETHHWHECNVCHVIEGEKVVHVYDNNCDTTCNICEAIRTITHDYSEVWNKDETHHWHECDVCHVIEGEKVVHIYDDSCDTTCNICGYIRTITHTLVGNEATCDRVQICSVCGEVIVPAHTTHDEYGICLICDFGATRGLTYKLNTDNASYTLTGIGTANVASITIPKYYNNLPVTNIGIKAFYNQTSIKAISISKKVITIDEYAFSGCINLSLVTFEKESILENIKQYAFYKTSINNIDFPDTIKTIDTCAFNACSKLRSVTLDGNLITIGSSAFSYCSNLTSVTIGENVTTIESYAFSNCTSLAYVRLGANVKTINEFTFSGCGNLTTVRFDGVHATYLSNNNSLGYLINKATTLYIKNGVTPSDYINRAFTVASAQDVSGYTKYIKTV